ncbi:MAG: phytoene/squalene synthase family protein [Chitinophagales bacterium]
MKQLFDSVSLDCSKRVTTAYSTSFSLGIKALDKRLHAPIYAIYGYVRFADEIVDTFHDYNKKKLLEKFAKDTYLAIAEGISLNPILNSFQLVVNQYNINHELIATFLKSMEMDLEQDEHNQLSFEEYILGSAEVVGLMCLTVFCEGNMQDYEKLKPYAMSLGAAFQKINFLRDLKDDYQDLGRSYFPNLDVMQLNENTKKDILADIENDFSKGLQGIIQLPTSARFGVYIAYVYYYALFKKIANTQIDLLLKQRIRISNKHKALLFCQSYIKYTLGFVS